jgi:hypothetical protein
VTYVVSYDRWDRQREAIVFSLGDAARFAVQFMKDGRQNVRVRLPSGATLGFEDFEHAVFAGELTEASAAAFQPSRPRRPAAAPPVRAKLSWRVTGGAFGGRFAGPETTRGPCP